MEYAAQALFGEEVEIAHQSVPVGAAPREQYRYYEEYGVYAYPEQQPIWYLPVLLDFWEVSFNTREAEIIFVRYADSGQECLLGAGNRAHCPVGDRGAGQLQQQPVPSLYCDP